MDNEFGKLHGEYLSAKKMKNQTQMDVIINKMQQNLMQRNGGKDEYTTSTGEIICISTLEYEQLLPINGEMNRIEEQDSLDEISNDTRANMLCQNRYTPDNPYPSK